MSQRWPSRLGGGSATVHFFSARQPAAGILSQPACGQSGTTRFRRPQKFLGQVLDAQRSSVSLGANTI